MTTHDTSVRVVTAKDDMDAIFMMGFDVWHESLDQKSYLRTCRGSKKYRQGAWLVLEANQKLVSSMLVYSSGFALPLNCLGFGSIATDPSCRGKGYASTLIRGALLQPACCAASAIYLHADIGPSFYEQFGFVPLVEGGAKSTCMIRRNANAAPNTSAPLPDYF